MTGNLRPFALSFVKASAMDDFLACCLALVVGPPAGAPAAMPGMP